MDLNLELENIVMTKKVQHSFLSIDLLVLLFLNASIDWPWSCCNITGVTQRYFVLFYTVQWNRVKQ